MLLKNKDLNLILDSFLRAIRHHRTESGGVPSLAIVLTSDGKLAQFSGQSNRANVLPGERVRYLERGIYTLVREGKCKALGIPLDDAQRGETGQNGIGLFLEHQDSSAYRIHLPCWDDAVMRVVANDLVPILAEPKFFFKSRFS